MKQQLKIEKWHKVQNCFMNGPGGKSQGLSRSMLNIWDFQMKSGIIQNKVREDHPGTEIDSAVAKDFVM